MRESKNVATDYTDCTKKSVQFVQSVASFFLKKLGGEEAAEFLFLQGEAGENRCRLLEPQVVG